MDGRGWEPLVARMLVLHIFECFVVVPILRGGTDMFENVLRVLQALMWPMRNIFKPPRAVNDIVGVCAPMWVTMPITRLVWCNPNPIHQLETPTCPRSCQVFESLGLGSSILDHNGKHPSCTLECKATQERNYIECLRHIFRPTSSEIASGVRVRMLET